MLKLARRIWEALSVLFILLFLDDQQELKNGILKDDKRS